MLARLYIKNYALIETAEIEFDGGFNVITGETGAGKSILVGALECILGHKAGADAVRQGADRCIVEALFEFDADDPIIQRLAPLEALPEDGQLILRREIRAQGRSRAQVNGLSVPVGQLRRIGAVLIDLHGQHEHQSLLDSGQHAAFLDAYGGSTGTARTVAERYREAGQARRRLAERQEERQRLHQQDELRRYQLEEIRRLQPAPGEEEALQRELHLLDNLETLGQTTQQLHEALYQAEDSIVEQLGRARRQLERAAAADPALRSKVEALEGLIYSVEDLAGGLRDYSERLDADPRRLEQVHERLDALRQLRQKHGGSLDKVLALAAELERQEDRAGRLDDEIAALERQCQDLARRFAEACLTLAANRRRAAVGMRRSIEADLAAVGMQKAVFEVRLDRRPDAEGPVEDGGQRWQADANGLEKVEFYISANPGEAPRPLTRVASGGEISRIMLALKGAVAGKGTVPSLVFDEIDVGISGRIAAAVGKRIEQLSQAHQTVIITHLPQIASLAQRHFAVRKKQRQGRTLTSVHLLDAAGRTEAIAHLLAGKTVSATARRHAQELLN